jgi:hypothetical protein
MCESSCTTQNLYQDEQQSEYKIEAMYDNVLKLLSITEILITSKCKDLALIGDDFTNIILKHFIDDQIMASNEILIAFYRAKMEICEKYSRDQRKIIMAYVLSCEKIEKNN